MFIITNLVENKNYCGNKIIALFLPTGILYQRSPPRQELAI